MTSKTTKNKDVAATKAADTQTNESSAPFWKNQHGRVQGAAWKHLQEDGKTRFTISISRSYKDRETDRWHSVHYFDRKDLADVRAVCDGADEAILKAQDMTQAVDED